MNNKHINILIVDDEPNVRFMFRVALQAAGYHVSEAGDGPSALAQLAQTRDDIVLLDLKMPGQSGLEVLSALREAGNDVPVVMVSAHGSIPDAVAAMKLGAIDFLTKPLTPDSLRQVVGDIIDRFEDEHEEPIHASEAAPDETSVVIGTPVIDLSAAKRAINVRDFEKAAHLLQDALELNPDSAEANTLLGILEESRGQDHGAFHCYKTALRANPTYAPALTNLRRYCDRFGLNFDNPAINPAAGLLQATEMPNVGYHSTPKSTRGGGTL